MADSIQSVLDERRVFEPAGEFSEEAHVSSMEEYREQYRRSLDDPEGFWAEAARELHWFRPWDSVLNWNEPFAEWFSGGQTNASYNCLDL